MPDVAVLPDPPLTLLHCTERVAIYSGSCFDLLTLQAPPSELDAWAPKVVLSDPPYASWQYLRDLQAQETAYDEEKDAVWLASTNWWWQRWFVPLRTRLHGADTAAWLFQHPHYMGFSLRWAAFLEWPLDALLSCNGTQPEYLLRFSDADRLGWARGQQVLKAVALNAYGAGKSVEMLARLLAVSPAGTVLDPFCGAGSTLEAALLCGRRAIGIEREPEIAAQAVARLQAVEASGAVAPAYWNLTG